MDLTLGGSVEEKLSREESSGAGVKIAFTVIVNRLWARYAVSLIHSIVSFHTRLRVYDLVIALPMLANMYR